MKDRFFLNTNLFNPNLFVCSFDRSAPARTKRARDLIAGAVTSRKGIVSYQVRPGILEPHAQAVLSGP